MYSTSSCEWSSIQHLFVSGLLERGGSEQHKGPQSLFVEGLLEGGGVRTTTGLQSLFVQLRRNKEKGLQIGCSRGGGGSEQQRGHSLCL